MEIRPYKQGDETEIMALDARELPSFWNRRTLDNWHWKFTASNPAGHALIWVAEHDSHLVGHFAAVPYRLKVFDEIVTASHTIGALVDKKYRNRGLLKFVGEKLMDELVRHHIPFTWGFPNQLAHRFENVVLAYNDLVSFDRWTCPKKGIVSSPKDSAIRPITAFDSQADQLWQSCAPDYPIAVVRESIYLNWRYLQRPDWDYFPFGLYENDGLTGYIILKLYREEETLRGHIIDIFGRKDDARTFGRLIDRSLTYFNDNGVDEITVMIWGNPVIDALLTERGFTRTPNERPLILRVNMDHPRNAEVRDNTHWYFTMGDSTEIF
ncbi:MAG: GNAT family N-acetyltransferase [Candidatus Omnitrophota bacterium]